MSRIRANQITNQSADGAPTVQNGLVISGVTTSTTFSGSGASLTNLNASNIASGTVPTARLGSGTANSSTFLAGDSTFKTVTGTTINNNADNRVITGSGTANTLEAESSVVINGGNVGIGSDNPESNLTILVNSSSDGPVIRLRNPNGGDGTYIGRIQCGDTFGSFLTGINFFKHDTNDGEIRFRMKVDGTNADVLTLVDGNVGINDTDPSYALNVIGDNTASNGIGMLKGIIGVQNNTTAYGSYPTAGISFQTKYRTGPDVPLDVAAIYGGKENTTNGDKDGYMGFAVREEPGSGTQERMRITSEGHVLFSGLTTKNDPRNANGITLKSAAGVSFQNFGSNGSRNWRIRPDDQSRWGDLDFSVSPTANSATDWPDAAADKVLTLGYDGQVSKPRQASFAAMAGQNGYTLNGQVFPFNTTTHNIGSHFNTSNYRFTAPVAGRYLFTFYSILDTSGQGRYEILINGAADQNGTRVHMNNANGNWDNSSTSWILNLAANDYIQMYSHSNTNWHGNHWQRFCGELLS